MIADSTAVGWTKPDPRIFRHALDALGVSPEDAAFVGDSRPRDMEGARALAMPHVWLVDAGGGAGPAVLSGRPRHPLARRARERCWRERDRASGGIIAAGDGSRLRAGGYAMPKALVPVGGVPLIEATIANFAAAEHPLAGDHRQRGVARLRRLGAGALSPRSTSSSS